MTPRVRGGRSGFSCGYCCVIEGRSACLSVTPTPFIRPRPGDLGAAAGPFGTPRSSTPTTPQKTALLPPNPPERQQPQRNRHEPRDPLQLVLAQTRIGDAEP